uniref:Uncharacterized protein n=1 Tax=Trieres chinensis TaxID=1514140 RepID=A0A7S1YZ98_TRICV
MTMGNEGDNKGHEAFNEGGEATPSTALTTGRAGIIVESTQEESCLIVDANQDDFAGESGLTMETATVVPTQLSIHEDAGGLEDGAPGGVSQLSMDY